MSWEAAAAREMPHLAEIDGWLEAPTARITTYLMTYQTSRHLIGDVMEIGVYEGKYFFVLCHALRMYGGERAVAIDIFQSQRPLIESAWGVREVFEKNLKKYAPQCEVIVMESSSRDLSPEMIRGRMMTSEAQPFRFISIDGGHDEETVVNDLRLAEALLMPGGIVALDDWRPGGHPTWPGVIAGEVAYQIGGGTLVHIGSIPNKLLLTTSGHWAESYQQVLRDYTAPDDPE